jgi:FKBP-type peptidyl-prolyl cis-trans isomerase
MLAAVPCAALICGCSTRPTVPAAVTAVPAPAPADPARDRNSYLFGLTFGEQMHRLGITDEVSLDAITRGLKEGLQGGKIAPADQQQLQAFVKSVMEAVVLRNQAAAKDFLAHNALEPDVITTASGLQYKIIAPGDPAAKVIEPTNEVTVQYRGKLLDGSEFDSTYTRGAPASFPVNGVIKGWQEALVMMKPGAEWQLFVPPELGYGVSPKPGIPAGSLLIFDVELLSVKSNDAPAASPGRRITLPLPRPTPTPTPQSK